MEEAAAGPSGADIKKKPMLDQVCEAVRVLGKPRKGASVQAIKKYVLNAFEESEHGRITSHIKKALAKGEEAGVLVRPANCKNSVGATGSFLLKTEKPKMIDKPQKLPDDKINNKKKLYQPPDSEVAKKPIKPKVTKSKNPVKEEENENDDDSKSDDFPTQSTPKKSSHSEVEQKGAKPRALKKTAKSTKKDKTDTFTIKKHSSDSELADVKETVKRKNLKETAKTTTKNNKSGKSVASKETEKAPHVKNEKKKPRRILKSYNSDSVLL